MTSEVYKRNLVEENFKVEINLLPVTGSWEKRGEFKKLIENANKAGTNDYDMVANISVSLSTMLFSGLFIDLSELQKINLSHSWWMKDTVETYGINGSVFGLMGDIAHSYYSSLSIIALNTNLAEKYGVENTYGDLYSMVYSGNWTLDKMLEIGVAYGEDVDGNQSMTLGTDTFGFVARNVPSRLFMYGFDVHFFERTNDGKITIMPMSEKAINSYEKLYNAFNNLIYPNVNIEPSKTNIQKYFSEDRALMIQAYFSDLGSDNVRNMDSEYMVLPMPKYDTNQEDYITPLATEAGMIAIPVTASDPELTAMIMEYMGYIGQKNITPVYIDAALKSDRTE